MLIPSLSVIYGGTSKTSPALAAALGRRGFSVDLVTTDADGPCKLDVPLGCWVEQEGYRVRYFSRFGNAEYKFSPALLTWLVRHVQDYDLVHINSNFNFPVLACALACRLRGVPYLITPHGMLEPWALGYKAWKKHAYYRGIERPLVLRRAKAIQALNASEAENIRALKLGPSVVILPNGIEQAEAKEAEPSDVEAFLARFPQTRGKTLILFLHRIDPKKGLDLLSRAISVVHPRFPQTYVVVAGPDNAGFSGAAREFFEAAGVGDAVTFTGMLEGAVKRGALAAASVFVLPSYSEGFSISVLEAMAAGLPSVITTSCNFPEAGEADVAHVVAPETDAFAKALEKMLADPSAAQAMGRRAREFVLEHYTWDQIGARYERWLRSSFDEMPKQPIKAEMVT
jgi:glycosyltransferase involved in cell wall biosynthesis